MSIKTVSWVPVQELWQGCRWAHCSTASDAAGYCTRQAHKCVCVCVLMLVM